jgi:hypothetical protein
VAELDQILDPLGTGACDHIDRTQRRFRGSGPMAEPVYHPEQRRLTADIDCDTPVT